MHIEAGVDNGGDPGQLTEFIDDSVITGIVLAQDKLGPGRTIDVHHARARFLHPAGTIKSDRHEPGRLLSPFMVVEVVAGGFV